MFNIYFTHLISASSGYKFYQKVLIVEKFLQTFSISYGHIILLIVSNC